MPDDAVIIQQTKLWITDVVVGCNFCPFAASVVKMGTIYYRVEQSTSLQTCLNTVQQEMKRLDNDQRIETSFVIFPNAFARFDDYLNMVWFAEKALKKNAYQGIYQLASFHPLYRFAKSTDNDAANYTNRSVYPMLHLLREESISRALDHYKNPENIPINNIKFAREKGLAYMKLLRDACMNE